MIETIKNLSPILQALLATIFTWGLTAIGAAAVFLFRRFSQRALDAMLGFTGGVMIAASVWSLIIPALEISAGGKLPTWLPVAIGFLAGGLFFRIIDRLIPHLHLNFPVQKAEGVKTPWHRSTLLVLAITIHNIPEGLAIGVAFGAAAAGLPTATFAAAATLALGIGIQNLPEGTAISVPLHRDGMSKLKSFWYGQLSASVEPVAAVIGAAAVFIMQPILPYALAFAAGAMIFVVVEEIIPETQQNHNADISTIALMIGFVLMMSLDVSFG